MEQVIIRRTVGSAATRILCLIPNPIPSQFQIPDQIPIQNQSPKCYLASN